MSTLAPTTNATDRADYRCAAYRAMEPAWTITDDIKAGTERIRERRATYLPKFDGEDPVDYAARVSMTFVNSHYAQALEDHVGLVFSNPVKLDGDVPELLEELLENVDGEGNNYEVFMQDALLLALDHGHALILTDYPSVPDGTDLATARDQQLRPYLVLYSGKNALSWRTAYVGGVVVLSQLVLHETTTKTKGEYGDEDVNQYRVFTHEVLYDAQGVAIGLGDVSWALYSETGGTDKDSKVLVEEGRGLLRDQDDKALPRIPVRIVYGGRKSGVLTSKPHLLELAYTNLQETQLESDYAAVMHKCNVPTPVFIGRKSKKPGETVSMGQGIDIPLGGSAMFLEPSGAALAATRNRLMDIRAQIQRQGGFVTEATRQMTAMEAAMHARQRNARLVRAARSLQDAMEGALMDMALYLPIDGESGSITVNMDFGVAFDAQFMQLCLDAYEKGALPLDATLHVLKTGKLPEDFNPEDVALRALVEQAKSQKMTPEPDPADASTPEDEEDVGEEGDSEDAVGVDAKSDA